MSSSSFDTASWIRSLSDEAARCFLDAVLRKDGRMANDVKIDLQLRPNKKRARVGDDVDVLLYATPDDGLPIAIAAMRTILTWDSTILRLMGVNGIGAPEWAFSGFPPDAFHLNEHEKGLIPEDGNALWEGWGALGKTIAVMPNGTLLTTFNFVAIRPTDKKTRIRLLDFLQLPGRKEAETKVYDGVIPNKNIVGNMGRPAKMKVRDGLDAALGLDKVDDKKPVSYGVSGQNV